MIVLADILMIMGLCFFQLFLHPLHMHFVLAFLAGLIVITGDELFFFDQKAIWRLGICTISMIIFPEFCFFLPVFTYKAVEKKQWIFPIMGITLGIFHFSQGAFSVASFCMIILSIIISVLFLKKSKEMKILRQQLLKNIDSSREDNFLLEEKNKALRDKQDYEIYTATLRERNRIAREIHDNVGHMLTRSILLAGALKTINQDKSMNEPLLNLEKSLNMAMTSIRSSVHDLHDESINLESAAHELLEKFTFCKTNFQYNMSRGVPKNIKYCFLAILKEGLTNIVKHSCATFVNIKMQEHPGFYQLIIHDNGHESAKNNNGIGLSNMLQRVQELNGLFRVSQDNGFEIFITIPKECNI